MPGWARTRSSAPMVRETPAPLETTQVIDNLEDLDRRSPQLRCARSPEPPLLHQRSNSRPYPGKFQSENMGGVFPAFWVGLH